MKKLSPNPRQSEFFIKDRIFVRKSNLRSAYTLMELLLVLGLIIVISTIGFPAMQKLWSRSSLGSASESLRTELYKTRLTAMKAGEAYVFRYKAGTGQFETVPKTLFDSTNGSRDVRYVRILESNAVFERGLLHTKAAEPGEGTEPLEDLGARATTFSGGNVTFSRELGDAHTQSDGWSVPILFYPNGRTSSASIAIRNSDYRAELTLRGLTGTAQLGKVQAVK